MAALHICVSVFFIYWANNSLRREAGGIDRATRRRKRDALIILKKSQDEAQDLNIIFFILIVRLETKV